MSASASLFPAYGEDDWRKAAEVALKGASFERLASKTADGIRIEPVYRAGEGPRALRTGGTWRSHRAPRSSRRPTRPTPRRSMISRTARTACRSYSPARSAPMVLGSGDSIRRRCTRRSTACASTQRAFRARPRTRRARAGAQFRRPGRALGRSPPTAPYPSASIRSPPPRAALSRPTGRRTRSPMSTRALACAAWAFAGRSSPPTRAASTRRAEARRRSSRSRSPPASPPAPPRSGGHHARTRRARHRLPPRGRRGRIRDVVEIPRAARRLGARRGSLRARAGAGAYPRRERLAHDDGARSLRERDARGDGRLLCRARRRRQRERPAAYAGARSSRQSRSAPRPQRPAHSLARIQPRLSVADPAAGAARSRR